MTPEEKEIEACLHKIFKYCLKHKDTCEGCILYRQVTCGEARLGLCMMTYAPEIFGELENEEEETE